MGDTVTPRISKKLSFSHSHTHIHSQTHTDTYTHRHTHTHIHFSSSFRRITSSPDQIVLGTRASRSGDYATVCVTWRFYFPSVCLSLCLSVPLSVSVSLALPLSIVCFQLQCAQ